MTEELTWLDTKVREERGMIEIGMTINGEIGVWIAKGDCELPDGTGDTTAEAIADAFRSNPTGDNK